MNKLEEKYIKALEWLATYTDKDNIEDGFIRLILPLLEKNTYIVALNFFDLKITNHSNGIDFNNPFFNYYTVYKTEKKDIINHYINHLNYYVNEPGISIAPLIFDTINRDLIWAFKKACKFTCKIIPPNILRFDIPSTWLSYASPDPHLYSADEKNINKEFTRITNIKFTEKFTIRLSDQIDREKIADQLKDLLQDRIETWFNHDQEAFRTFTENFAHRLPYLSFLTQKGDFLYVTNNLFSLNDRIQGNGGIFIYANVVDIPTQNTTRILKRYTYLSNITNIFSSKFIVGRLYQTLQEAKSKSQQESIKSAKAAIMSRNMSHNLGSHVMAYLKQHLNSVVDILKGNVVEKLITDATWDPQNIQIWEKYIKNELNRTDEEFDTSTETNHSTSPNPSAYKNQIELPFLVGLGHFISYLQERQDYIATVSTDYVPYYSSVNFKDHIYDELNPDLRYLRHTDRIGGRPENLLLAYIAKSEGLQRPSYARALPYKGRRIQAKSAEEYQMLLSNCLEKRTHDIILKFRTFDGINDAAFSQHTILPESGSAKETAFFAKRNNDHILKNTPPYNDLNDMRLLDCSLPGGISGRQAVFSIVENIIRNAAKHGNWRSTLEKHLELTFDLYDCSAQDPRFASDQIDPETKKLKDFLQQNQYFTGKDAGDLSICTITDNLSISQTQVDRLNDAIHRQGYVDESGVMINENKGIKEIQISSSWIRNLTHEEEETGNVPILNARLFHGHLQYVLCLPKVKDIAVIYTDEQTDLPLNKPSVSYYTVDTFLKERNKSFNLLALYDPAAKDDRNDRDENTPDQNYETAYRRLAPVSPNRIVRIAKTDLETIVASQAGTSAFEKVINDLYQKLYQGNETDRITVIDDKTATAHSRLSPKQKQKCDSHITCKAAESGEPGKYLYMTHLETEHNFYRFLDSYVENQTPPLFAEGISGGNSTDRLIRGTSGLFTNRWYHTHLNAMRKKVAIFDERIFSHATNLLDNDLKEKETEPTDASTRSIADDPLCARSHLIAVHHYKNTYIYTIVYDSQTDRFCLYGYDKHLHTNGNYQFVIRKIATLFRSANKEPQIEPVTSLARPFSFDYLTVHQGLLDKIYHQWDLTSKIDKCKITELFFQTFLPEHEKIPFGDYCYLPGLIIHSGRAKPSESDMPQKQPFIQYASLDHAVSDCKYTLIELLDNARYE